MSEKTLISFAHHTGSPWIGCTKVNDDCANCYADWIDEKRFSKTLGGASKENPIRHWGKGKPRFRTVGFWNDARKFNARPFVCNICGHDVAEQLSNCPQCNGDLTGFSRARMFPSLCDWLDDEVPIEWLVDFLKVIYECQNLTWMLFTKRPELWHSRLTAALESITDGTGKDGQFWQWLLEWIGGNPPKHVWIFASAGNQKNADIMIPALLKIPARFHGVSCEPMTGPVDFELYFEFEDDKERTHIGIDVVIFGGESDQARPARPCNLQWIADGVKQCQNAGVLAYVKQLGSHILCDNVNLFDWPQANEDGPMMSDSSLASGFAAGRILLNHKSGAEMAEWPDQLRVQELPDSH